MVFGRKEKKYWIVCPGNLTPSSLPLGSILGLPYAPDASILNFGSIEPIDAHLIKPETELARFAVSQAFNAGLGAKLEVSSPLAPLLSVAPSLGLNFHSTRVESLQAKRFCVTTFWNPPKEYVDRALRIPEVMEYIKESWFTNPVYMVVSVAVAAVVTRDSRNSSSIDANAGVSVSPPGTGVAFATELSGSRGSRGRLEEETVEQDTILAYRVRRIQYEKRKDVFVKAKDNESSFGLFGQEHDQEEDREDDDNGDSDVPRFTYSVEVGEDEAGQLCFAEMEADSGHLVQEEVGEEEDGV